MVPLSTDLLGYIVDLLQVEVDLALRRLDSEAAVRGQAVVPNLTLLNSAFEEFERARQSVEEHIVRVMGSLRLVRILKIVNVEAIEV